jgi:integrase
MRRTENVKNLTPEQIRLFSCPADKKQEFLWDTKSPRLAVRVTASGAKSFIFEGKLNRQTIRRTIGDCAHWTIEKARKEANELKVKLDKGIDPREEDRERETAKATQKAAQEAADKDAKEQAFYTLRALCEAYALHLGNGGKKKSAASALSAFKCHVFTHPKIADKPAREVTSDDIAELVREVKEAGKERTAGILRSYLLAAFNVAKRARYNTAIPVALRRYRIEHNPVEVVPALAVAESDRTLTAAELKAYLSHLGDALSDKALRLALLAGGQRIAQLMRAKVTDYDPDTKTLRLLDPKGKRAKPREHLLPLAPKAAALVAGLIAHAKEERTPWLFASHGETLMATETPGKRLAEICAAMESEPFNVRDIRRTCETMLASMGISRDTRAQLLSHGISGVQAKHYDRHDYANEKRAALVAWEARLDEITSGRKSAKVVRMKRRA